MDALSVVFTKLHIAIYFFFIDRFLKIGLAVSIFSFISDGIGITVEAWSHVSGNKLPERIDKLIVEIIEPNCTPGLLVLLGFSIFWAFSLRHSEEQIRQAHRKVTCYQSDENQIDIVPTHSDIIFYIFLRWKMRWSVAGFRALNALQALVMIFIVKDTFNRC